MFVIQWRQVAKWIPSDRERACNLGFEYFVAEARAADVGFLMCRGSRRPFGGGVCPGPS